MDNSREYAQPVRIVKKQKRIFQYQKYLFSKTGLLGEQPSFPISVLHELNGKDLEQNASIRKIVWLYLNCKNSVIDNESIQEVTFSGKWHHTDDSRLMTC